MSADHMPPGEWRVLLSVFAHVTKVFGGDYEAALKDIKRVLANGQVRAMVRPLTDDKGHELPVEFWQTHKFSSVGPNHIIVRSKEYPPNEFRFFLRQRAMEKVWSTTSQPAPAADEAWWGKNVAGAKGNFDWEKIVGKAALHMHVNGVPKSLADLCSHAEKWFPAGKAPSETQLRDHLRPVYRDFKEADSK